MYNIIYNKNISKIKKQKYEKVIEFVTSDLKLNQDMEISFVGSDCLYGYDGSMHKAKNNIDYCEYDAEEYAYQTSQKKKGMIKIPHALINT